jgi:NAD(P)-dependent dehydrogenase (short-subunit alcohol dehydrogenase family)
MNRVVIVFDAGSTEGRRTARALLADGCRVVAVDRHAATLVPILYGQRAEDVLLLAADGAQTAQVVSRAKDRFGQVDSILWSTASPLPLSA